MSSLSLTPNEELELQQLEQIHFWQIRAEGLNIHEPSAESKTTDNKTKVLVPPERWELTRGIQLHDWQTKCVDEWFVAGKRGVIKVVTGAGKTILALAIIERLQQTMIPDLRVAVVVPTIVLLDQWRDEIVERSNLPDACIGFMGAGRTGSFQTGARIIISVLNSASKKLAEDVERSRISDRLLLIVDECHRAGASEMRRVFETKRAFSLGLSATPEREADIGDEVLDEDQEKYKTLDTPAFETTVLGQELGSVIFELNYADAIKQAILPPFQIVHYGLPLSEEERRQYERISREIKDLQSDLQTRNRRGLALIRWCKSQAQSGDGKAARYISLLGDRKRLLYSIRSRAAAVEAILADNFAQNRETKAILFHESIEEVMRLFGRLRELGFEVVAEHSGFPDSMRATSVRLFETESHV